MNPIPPPLGPNRIQEHIFKAASILIQADIQELNAKFESDVKEAHTQYRKSLSDAKASYEKKYKSHNKDARQDDANTYKLATENATRLYKSRISQLENAQAAAVIKVEATIQSRAIESFQKRGGWAVSRNEALAPSQALFIAVLMQDLLLRLAQSFASKIDFHLLEAQNREATLQEKKRLQPTPRIPVKIEELGLLIEKHADGTNISPDDINKFIKDYTANPEYKVRTDLERTAYIEKIPEEAKRHFKALAIKPQAYAEVFKIYTSQYADADSIKIVTDFVSKQPVASLAQQDKAFSRPLLQASSALADTEDQSLNALLKHAASVSSSLEPRLTPKRNIISRILSTLWKTISNLRHKNRKKMRVMSQQNLMDEGQSLFERTRPLGGDPTTKHRTMTTIFSSQKHRPLKGATGSPGETAVPDKEKTTKRKNT